MNTPENFEKARETASKAARDYLIKHNSWWFTPAAGDHFDQAVGIAISVYNVELLGAAEMNGAADYAPIVPGDVALLAERLAKVEDRLAKHGHAINTNADAGIELQAAVVAIENQIGTLDAMAQLAERLMRNEEQREIAANARRFNAADKPVEPDEEYKDLRERHDNLLAIIVKRDEEIAALRAERVKLQGENELLRAELATRAADAEPGLLRSYE